MVTVKPWFFFFFFTIRFVEFGYSTRTTPESESAATNEGKTLLFQQKYYNIVIRPSSRYFNLYNIINERSSENECVLAAYITHVKA